MMDPMLFERRDFLRGMVGAGILAGAAFATACASGSVGRAAARPREPGLPSLRLQHRSGASAEIFLQGAHIASWKRADGEEMLFLSRQSRFEPGVAIRGGIPIIFPQFAGLGPLPSHGFARNLPWTVTESGVDAGGGAFARLQRTDDESTRAQWPHSFRAEYHVSLDEALTTTLRVTNTGEQPFGFQSALHTYHRVDDIRQVLIEGLEGVRYRERGEGEGEQPAASEPLRIRGETDRIYLDAPDRLRVRDAARGLTLVIEKQGFADAVVWNPWIDRARALADLGDDEYEVMLCVEPANIVVPTRLVPGEVWSGTQRIRVESPGD
jgi:glucose-6-phosphate 1-epimerase